MKLISKKEYKTVDFHGIGLTVSKDANFLAADYNGKVWGYKNDKPRKNHKTECWTGHACGQVAIVDLEGMDWRETLIEC